MQTVLGIIALIAFIWVVYNAWFVNRSLSTTAKVLWSVAAFFFSIVTAVVYYFVEKPKALA
ncbi:MAG: hypothetical protein AAGI23_20610 [Bacteroidota bacterium]